MKNKLDFESKPSLGFFRALMMCVGFMALAFTLCFYVFGCTTVKKYGPMVVHAVFDMSAMTNKVESVASVDAVPFDSLKWDFGGFKPSASTVVKGKISTVAFNGSMVTYASTVDADWGGEGDSPRATICALFFKDSGGTWRGGKFDWIGFLGKPRPAQHIKDYGDGKSQWAHAYPAPKGEEFAFVLIRGDNGKSRTNVIAGEVK